MWIISRLIIYTDQLNTASVTDTDTVTDIIFFWNKISNLSEEQIVWYLWGLILNAKCIFLLTLLMIEIRLRKNENLLSFRNNLSIHMCYSLARKVMKCLFSQALAGCFSDEWKSKERSWLKIEKWLGRHSDLSKLLLFGKYIFLITQELTWISEKKITHIPNI